MTDDIIIRLRRTYDETGNALLGDAIEEIANARALLAGEGNSATAAAVPLPSAAEAILQEALKDARNYVDAVVSNSGDTKRRANYRACVSRIDGALAAANAFTLRQSASKMSDGKGSQGWMKHD